MMVARQILVILLEAWTFVVIMMKLFTQMMAVKLILVIVMFLVT